MSKQFNNVFIPSDTSGTFIWRAMFQINQINCIATQLGIANNVVTRPPLEANYYNGIDMVMVQRTVNESQLQLIDWLHNISQVNGMQIIQNIDDLTDAKYIPKFNRGRRAFLGQKTQDNIKHMYNACDYMLTTTDYLKNKFHECYDVPLDNIICIPNYLPRWWIGDRYHPLNKVEEFKQNRKTKLRIGIVSSLSHYNIDNIRQLPNGDAVYEIRDAKNEIIGYVDEKNNKISKETGDKLPLVQDDLDLILDTIRDTVNRYQWVFFGYKPPKLEKLIDEGKIEYHGGVAILNYPSMLDNLHLNAIVAPVIDDEFNKCKSNIKYLEAAAIGVPLIASNVAPTYSNYVPKEQLFNNQEELKSRLDELTYMSTARYQSIVENQWKWLNSPHNECGIPSMNWWLEDNLGPWVNIMRIRSKGVTLSLKNYLAQKKAIEEAKAKAEAEKKIAYKDNDLEIIK